MKGEFRVTRLMPEVYATEFVNNGSVQWQMGWPTPSLASKVASCLRVAYEHGWTDAEAYARKCGYADTCNDCGKEVDRDFLLEGLCPDCLKAEEKPRSFCSRCEGILLDDEEEKGLCANCKTALADGSCCRVCDAYLAPVIDGAGVDICASCARQEKEGNQALEEEIVQAELCARCAGVLITKDEEAEGLCLACQMVVASEEQEQELENEDELG